MTSKKHDSLFIKIPLLKILFFKKTNLCLPLPQRFQKTLARKRKHLKNFSKYIFGQPKQHQHKIRSKTNILLKINSIPNLIKILTLATAPFLLFQLVPCLSVNLLQCQEYTFYCAPRKKRYTLLPESTDVHIQQHNHQKDLKPCLTLYYYGNIIVELEENTYQEFNCLWCL